MIHIRCHMCADFVKTCLAAVTTLRDYQASKARPSKEAASIAATMDRNELRRGRIRLCNAYADVRWPFCYDDEATVPVEELQFRCTVFVHQAERACQQRLATRMAGIARDLGRMLGGDDTLRAVLALAKWMLNDALDGKPPSDNVRQAADVVLAALVSFRARISDSPSLVPPFQPSQ
jgi:hypothetical protein